MSQQQERDGHNGYLQIPEYALYETINTCLNVIRKEVQDPSINDENTYLYQIMKGLGYKRIDIYEILKSIFEHSEEHPDYLIATLGWPEKISSNLQLCVIQKNDAHASDNALGVGAYATYIENEDEETYQEVFSRNYQSNCSIMLVGNNTSEITALTTFLKGLLIAFESSSYFSEYFGWRHIQITSRDVQLNANITPKTYFKTIDLSFDYTFYIPAMERLKSLGNLVFNSTILIDKP